MSQAISPLDQCTDRARKTLRLAGALSRHRVHSDINGQDFLDALSHDGSLAKAVLRECGYQSVTLPINLTLVDDQAVAASQALRELLDEAIGEVRRLGHRYVGTEHLLIALMRTYPELMQDSDGVVVEVLQILGHT